ncbi:MAG TPA: recombinase family protein, partial [Tepidisphaeraceae bacterium]|nr:recombinase family protein [Tepidisphaeraceae bacterium]
PKLAVNETEAEQVRRIFATYLENRALIPAVTAITALGWTTKAWVGRDGTPRGGQPFNKSTLHQLLTNVVYTGKVRYKDEVHPGEHAAIVDEETYQKVQAVLARNGKTGGAAVRNRYGAILKGLLRCSPCDCSMGHTYTSKGSKRYSYYICLNAHKRGWDTCPSLPLRASSFGCSASLAGAATVVFAFAGRFAAGATSAGSGSPAGAIASCWASGARCGASGSAAAGRRWRTSFTRTGLPMSLTAFHPVLAGPRMVTPTHRLLTFASYASPTCTWSFVMFAPALNS